MSGRSSYEERGLKYNSFLIPPVYFVALHTRSVDWNWCRTHFKSNLLSLFIRGAWIEILSAFFPPSFIWSLFIRGAWIEIVMPSYRDLYSCRSSYEERGLKYSLQKLFSGWPRRSSYEERGLKFPYRVFWYELAVALHTRSVDWNRPREKRILREKSLFIRGAWIEIPMLVHL